MGSWFSWFSTVTHKKCRFFCPSGGKDLASQQPSLLSIKITQQSFVKICACFKSTNTEITVGRFKNGEAQIPCVSCAKGN
jgi:hypothetical protein